MGREKIMPPSLIQAPLDQFGRSKKHYFVEELAEAWHTGVLTMRHLVWQELGHIPSSIPEAVMWKIYCRLMATPIERKYQWYVYSLSDPRTHKVKYVGTTTDKEKRFKGHLSERSRTEKTAWIAELREQALVPVMETLESGNSGWSEQTACERRWITHFSANGELFNVLGVPTREVQVQDAA